MSGAGNDPFNDGPPSEVPLPRAPLARVVGQVRFPKVLTIGSGLSVAPFQEMIREQYPVLQEEKIQALHFIGLQPEARVETIWRFSDPEGGWKVSLASDFLAIDTKSYTARSDFIARLVDVIDALASTIDPKTSTRMGIRYISRVAGAEYEMLPKLLEPSVLGVAGLPTFSSAYKLYMSEAVLKVKEGESRLRWGFLPNNTIHEPDIIEPIESRSWLCDIDTFSEEKRAFSAKSLRPTATALAERCYSVFRAMVKSDFLKAYGGKP